MWNSSSTEWDPRFTTISIHHKNHPQRVTKMYYDFELHRSFMSDEYVNESPIEWINTKININLIYAGVQWIRFKLQTIFTDSNARDFIHNSFFSVIKVMFTHLMNSNSRGLWRWTAIKNIYKLWILPSTILLLQCLWKLVKLNGKNVHFFGEVVDVRYAVQKIYRSTREIVIKQHNFFLFFIHTYLP